MLKVCGLWEHTTADGKWYLTGTIGGVKVVIMQNNFKQAENQPDYNMLFAEKQQDRPQGYSQHGGGEYNGSYEPERAERRGGPPQGNRPMPRQGNARGQDSRHRGAPNTRAYEARRHNPPPQNRQEEYDEFGDPFAE